ncbi:ArsR/SmtB family transcription factor [Pengzhenrongella frigida]|uniref:ArsR family transcriptional regulator n=1 Tax=Pengzhenrongella frigida TaxID=1259133 RepID=A0A4Q5N5D8_9MICO|nr:metalloregulator ArsR/SmtB family transcription factor [Cellulomonas sp. HLT2-17]RYV51321.1 ArsR family transcriptional regulator [Cellulomonas sp. HLT2-17]
MSPSVSIEVSPAGLTSLAAQFALLADPLRLRIVDSLSREQLCTCHLIELTGAKQTTISHHLRLLREAGVVLSEAEGRFTWYRLTPGVFTESLRRLQGIALDSASTARLRPACAS